MIHQIASSGVHAADIGAFRKNRAKKTETAQDTVVETAKAQKPAHPVRPHGHIPPGLARASEKIASRIFARADADGNGTVTRNELSAVHSKHARTLASSDLFQATVTEKPADITAETALPGTASEPPTDETTGTTAETTTQAPAEGGVTEAQLKEALTKFFYAKIGITYTPPSRPITEQPNPAEPVDTTTPSVVDPISDESSSSQTFVAVA